MIQLGFAENENEIKKIIAPPPLTEIGGLTTMASTSQ
jgi:hypothetical protein